MQLYNVNISVVMRGERGKEAEESLREEVQAAVKAILMEDFDRGVRVDVDAITDVGPAGRRAYEQTSF